MKRLVLATALAAGLTGCGNYSNEDIDFQLALPGDGELEAKLPQALTLPNSSELYLKTRAVVRLFNGIAASLVGLVDHVRRHPPSSRQGNRRVWGPFADDKHPAWQIRVVMDRVDDAAAPESFKVAYALQLRRAGEPESSFFDFGSGEYSASGSARRGEGKVEVHTRQARAVSYPVDDPSDPDDLGSLLDLQLSYRTASYPIHVHMHIENEPANPKPDEAREALYDYWENADGSGRLSFNWKLAQPVNGIADAEMTSRWLGSGAGRADARVPLAPLNVTVATDCWGIDTVATWVWRSWDGTSNGSAATCVIEDAAP